MEAPPEQKPPVGTKRAFFWAYFILTPAVILILYVSSAGPVYVMRLNGSISQNNQFVIRFYKPLGWAYDETPLHKPLGMYMHLWVPKELDRNGDKMGAHK